MLSFYDADRNPINPEKKDLILGQCFGIMLEKRGRYVALGRAYDQAPLIHLMVEDDDNWFVKKFSLDAGWIDDMIKVLTETKARIKQNGY